MSISIQDKFKYYKTISKVIYNYYNTTSELIKDKSRPLYTYLATYLPKILVAILAASLPLSSFLLSPLKKEAIKKILLQPISQNIFFV